MDRPLDESNGAVDPAPVEQPVVDPTATTTAGVGSGGIVVNTVGNSNKSSTTNPNPDKASETSATTTSTTITAPVDQAQKQLQDLVSSSIDKVLDKEQRDYIATLLKDHEGLKEKVGKLKALLGRSAKAQREAKVDLDATQKRLDHALREIERLNQKIDKLANRPTHMELIADFETNFDRALLSVGHHQEQQKEENQQQQQHQSVGEDTGSPPPSASAVAGGSLQESSSVVENLLLQEMAEHKSRIEKLEGMNRALTYKTQQMENDAKDRRRERDELANQIRSLELEKRMAVMEAEHATRTIMQKDASLKEMQMEIDLVTKASVTANARAAQGKELMKTALTDKQHVQKLEAQVAALQEWAAASAEAKAVAQERVRYLEQQVRNQQKSGDNDSGSLDSAGRNIFTKTGSLVIGAGDEGFRVFALTATDAKQLQGSDRLLMRWKFDITPEDSTINFAVLKGDCSTAVQRKEAGVLIPTRLVQGGAGGELERAFETKGASTFLWSNKNSWIKPRTIRYNVEAVVLAD